MAETATSERQVRTGIIGCGKIAPMHAEALGTLPSSRFVAACDPFPERAKETAERYGAERVFTDPFALLSSGEVQAVCICTPHPSHGDLVVAAADAGVHVLCEKPIAVKLAEADRMIAATERRGITFSAIFQRRFWPAAQRIRAAIDAGKLGPLTLGQTTALLWRPEGYFASDPWRGKWATEGGGALMNQAVHFVDLLQWFMGPAVEVVGRIDTLVHGDYIDVEDTAVATVRFANGALATILAATTVNPNFGFRVAVHGAKGATVSVWENPEGAQGINDVWTIPGEEEQRSVWEREDAGKPGFPSFHRRQIEEFLAAILAGREPAVTGAEGRKALELILAIYHSSRTGEAVTLPLETDPE